MTNPKRPAIELRAVNSSNVHSIGHDSASKTMAVKFRNGGEYHYPQVDDELYGKVRDAPSVGRAVNEHLRSRGEEFNGVRQPEPKDDATE